MIIDEDYAHGIGLPIKRERECRTRVQFADGSTAETSGMIYGVEWRFGPGVCEQRYQLDFHVLKNSPAKVILKDSLLYETKAFSEFDCYLIDDDEEEEDGDACFFVINLATKYLQNGAFRNRLLGELSQLTRLQAAPI